MRFPKLTNLFGITRCKLCGDLLPDKPDYVHDKDGHEMIICNECGDVLEAMHAIKTGDDTWLKQRRSTSSTR